MSAAFWLANIAGLAGFAWPLFLSSSTAPPGGAHATDAPVLIALLVPLLVVVAMDEARGDHGDARLIALLAALVAANALLRIPKGVNGEGLVFVLPILAGWFIGGRFAFLLGSFSMLASAVLTGGAGPWLPFQMLGLGWVGGGAALARRLVRGRLPVLALAGYGYIASLGYGFVLNLWFWPFLGETGEVFFRPGLGVAETLRRYWSFYLLTSLPWDTARGLLTNVPLLVLLTRPVGSLLERTRERFTATYELPVEAPVRWHGERARRPDPVH